MNVTDLKQGNYFLDEGNLYLALDVNLNKTAMRKMVVKIKVKNMRSGAITEISRNSGYDVERTTLTKKKMSYLYDAGDYLVFMDVDTYDQFEIQKSKLEWELNFLVPNSEIDVVFFENELIGLSLPPVVTLTIADCELSVRGDTINRALKKATLETGFELKVQEFINAGDKVLIRTDTGECLGRA